MRLLIVRFLMLIVLEEKVNGNTFGVPNQPTIVSTQNGDRRVFVQERKQDGTLSGPYALTIKGMNWSPASTNSNPPGDTNGFRQEFFKWYTNDIPLMANMGLNVIRLYYDFGTNSQAKAMLDMFYQYGIKVILPVTAPYYNDTANSNNIPTIVNAFKNHPAIFGWGIGNEWDINYYYKPNIFPTLQSAAQFTEKSAQIVIGLDTNHPVISFYGDPHIPLSTPVPSTGSYHYLNPDTAPWQPTDGSVNFTSIVISNWVPSVKIWGLQLYRNASFTDAFSQWEQISTKPMFVSEFGADSFDHRIMAENQVMQRDFNVGLWDEFSFNSASERKYGVVSGVLGFEFQDEWYKGGNPGVHNYSTETNSGQPDGTPGYNDEKWFGWLDIFRQPKLVYTAFQQRFALDGQNSIPLVTNPVLSVTSGGLAIFQLNGKIIFSRGGGDLGARGLNIGILDEKAGNRCKEYRHFDSWYYQNSGSYKQSIADYLNAIPNGSIIMIAVADNSGLFHYTIDQPIYQALTDMGSTQINTAPATSWAMITVKGTGKLAESSTTAPITATNHLTLDRDAGRRYPLIQVIRPFMQGIKQTNGNFKITFQSQDAIVYLIEYRDDLKTGTWQLAQRGIVADGSATIWVDDGSFTSGTFPKQRFYRVIAIDRVTRM